MGLWLLLNESDYRRPLARTRGVLRLPNDVAPTALATALNALMALTAQYLQNLPGVPEDIDRQARLALRHAGTATLEIFRLLKSGEPTRDLERTFGGAALLVFEARPRAVTLSATG